MSYFIPSCIMCLILLEKRDKMIVQIGADALTRINLIDVIRGIAIISILLINIHFFEPSNTKSIEINIFDSKVINYIEIFSLNKFHFLFAFLLGVSTSIFIIYLFSKELPI